MTKVLYIPNGMFIQFPVNLGYEKYTIYFEEASIATMVSCKTFIEMLCNPGSWLFFKNINNIPYNVSLLEEEFEIITDD